MVFMEDSERAAELAKEINIDAGLHLNFTQPFETRRCASNLREKHGQIASFLAKSKFAQLVFHPGLRQQFDYVFHAQLEEYLIRFGKMPSHFDGHHHMHLCSNMLLGQIIPGGAKIRQSFSFLSGQKGIMNRGYRWLVNRWVRRMYRAPDFLFALPDCLKIEKSWDRVIALALQANVELETHPEEPAELEWLLSDECIQMRALVKTGSYAEL